MIYMVRMLFKYGYKTQNRTYRVEYTYSSAFHFFLQQVLYYCFINTLIFNSFLYFW